MDYKDFNDYELLYMIEEENDYAKDMLYQKYLPLIRTEAIKFYKSLKKYGVDYDDLYQEAHLAFLRTIQFFNEKENTLFYTFLKINIRSKLLNYAKIIKSQKNTFYTGMVSLNNPISIDNDICLIDCVKDEKQIDPTTVLENIEREKVFRKFSLKLIPLHSQMFDLLCAGFNIKEISILLDMEQKEVSNSVYRIRKKLKNYLISFQ